MLTKSLSLVGQQHALTRTSSRVPRRRITLSELLSVQAKQPAPADVATDVAGLQQVTIRSIVPLPRLAPCWYSSS